MRNGILVAHSEALEGVSGGVSEVEGTANAAFVRVLANDVGFHLHRFTEQVKKVVVVAALEVVGKEPVVGFGTLQQSVLQHLGKSRLYLGERQG